MRPIKAVRILRCCLPNPAHNHYAGQARSSVMDVLRDSASAICLLVSGPFVPVMLHQSDLSSSSPYRRRVWVYIPAGGLRRAKLLEFCSHNIHDPTLGDRHIAMRFARPQRQPGLNRLFPTGSTEPVTENIGETLGGKSKQFNSMGRQRKQQRLQIPSRHPSPRYDALRTRGLCVYPPSLWRCDLKSIAHADGSLSISE